jgi:hypothetical protein
MTMGQCGNDYDVWLLVLYAMRCPYPSPFAGILADSLKNGQVLICDGSFLFFRWSQDD